MYLTAKRSNGGTVRKHTIKKLNGESKTADKIAKGDINQNNAIENATSPIDTSNLSESTIQAFQDALHFKPLSQVQNDVQQVNLNDQTTKPSDQQIEKPVDNNENNYIDINVDNRLLFQGISLKDFEKHHQLMKEANIEKRRLLSNAIEQR